MGKGGGNPAALAVAKNTVPGHRGDGGGLWLQISTAGTKSWIFRFKSPVTGKAREMGPGSLDTLSLAEARNSAKDARQLVASGRDPIIESIAERQRIQLEEARTQTFDQCAEQFLATRRAGWKNPKHAAQWETTLAMYASLVIGHLPVAAVDVSLVQRILNPIWTEKNETASRLRGRIEAVLDWAKVNGYRTGDNTGHEEDTHRALPRHPRPRHPALSRHARRQTHHRQSG